MKLRKRERKERKGKSMVEIIAWSLENFNKLYTFCNAY